MVKPVTLNLIVDKSCNRVIFAQSDGHFVDILLSFLTLPLSSILQLTNQSIGSINNILESVRSLDTDCFISEACRSMLLFPSNSAAKLFSSLPIKYDSISNLFGFYYTCSSCFCNCLSLYANAHCQCGKLMDKKLEVMDEAASSDAEYSSVFFNEALKFGISDDLLVSQSSVEFSIEQLSKLDIKQMNSLESLSVDITAENIVDLLKRLLVSDTPLTDVFLGILKEKDELQVIQQSLCSKSNETKALTTSTGKFSLKLYVNDEDTSLIAESDNDFVDLLFGFLTYPMGAVISKFGGQSGIRCMDNLYNSVEALKPANCFKNNELIEKLLNPRLPPFFKVKNQLINLLEVTPTQKYFSCTNKVCHYSSKVSNNGWACRHNSIERRQLHLSDPKRGCKGDHRAGGGYTKISKYMVTDNLVIRQPTSYMLITDILKEAAGKKICARNVEIGEKEALSLLGASIVSGKVLTDLLLTEFSSPVSILRSKIVNFGSLLLGGMKGGDQKLKKVMGLEQPLLIPHNQIGVCDSRTDKFLLLLGVERGSRHCSRHLNFHLLFAAAALCCIVLVIFYWRKNVCSIF